MKSVSIASSALLLAAAAVQSVSANVLGARAPNNANGTDIDTVILQYALTLEHLENAFYNQSLQAYDADAFAKAGYPAGVRQRYTEIAYDETTHVATLSAALGDAATKPCTYNFSAVTDPKSFVAVSAVLENVGVGAYLGAAANITEPAYLSVAAAILTVEARHESWIVGAVQNGTAYPNPFDTPLTSFSVVYTLASQFIQSCPEGNPALPVTKFASLASNATQAKSGETISLTFDDSANKGSAVFAAFLNGLTPAIASISEDNSVVVPAGLAGPAYIVVLKENSTITDENVIAGVAVLAVN